MISGFPNFEISKDGEVSSSFRSLGSTTFADAATYVRALPYRRNTDLSDRLCVLKEGRGTCSSKHVLLGRLAEEQEAAIDLMLGIYEMNAENTKGVGSVLRKRALQSVPEAHCYLRAGSDRWDFTRPENPLLVQIRFLLEVALSPDEVVAKKIDIHRDFIAKWIKQPGKPKLKLDEIWTIREECIAALAEG
jgi:hypothetical protein